MPKDPALTFGLSVVVSPDGQALKGGWEAYLGSSTEFAGRLDPDMTGMPVDRAIADLLEQALEWLDVQSATKPPRTQPPENGGEAKGVQRRPRRRAGQVVPVSKGRTRPRGAKY